MVRQGRSGFEHRSDLAVYCAEHLRPQGRRLAEKETVPVCIREMTDAQVLEAQLVENLQRQDVHPLHEAQGFAALLRLEEPKYSIELIAAKCGKSAGYVASRLRLTELAPAAVEAFTKDEIGLGHALLLAKLQPEQQQEALTACWQESYTGGSKAKRILLPVRHLREWIEHNILLELATAPFLKEDATLVPEAGSCHGCPKRTGHNTLLFEGIAAQHDSCSDPACYAAKVDAHVKRAVAAKPKLVQITTAYGKPAEGSPVVPRNQYVEIRQEKPKNKYQQDAPEYKTCKYTAEAIVADGTDKGEIRKVCANPDCPVHHPKKQQRRADPDAATKAAQEKQRREEAIANTTGNDEDIGTLRLLYEGGIPAIVLLSKADLLADADLGRVTGYIETQVQDELGLKFHVQPVSALSNHSGLLNRFFEQELLPRFNKARSLREASVARKVGALRESVIAALETSLQRGKRENLPSSDGKEIEARLRHISGETGEQRTHLDQAFLELGERPEVILAELAEMAAARICSGASNRIDSSLLVEWTEDVVQKHVDRALARTQTALRDAVEGLREIANEINRSEMPVQDETDILLRNVPRFEMASAPHQIGVTFWRWLGRRAARAFARQSLQEAFGEAFKDELHRYGRALSQWGEHTTRRIQAFMSSYADAYRAQLSRMRGLSAEGTVAPELENDLSLLLKWNREADAETAETRG